ncbi:hypothetical protein MNB_SV-12-932 [hydrothermal vent metagenome]|uniref:Uncharacterized protein n=1 Tax=hydrothermal vent metagenome TaxID=652676 RepID=A0A1W1C7J7_9ZZZZ
MKKIVLIVLSFSTISTAFEAEYGSGTFAMKGGFLGLTGEITTDVSTYSLVDRHSNIGKFFYSYDLTWYDSKVLKQGQHTYNEFASDANSFLPSSSPATIPEMEYRLKGLDANIRLGYDVIHKDKDNFFGAGVLIGVSIPWIDSTKGDDDSTPSLGFMLDNASNIKDAKDMFADSKTEIMTYKIGPSINFQKSMTKNISFYGIGSYAYQTGYVKNSYADADFTVNGTFQELNMGLYFTPFTERYKWGWLTLSPRVYATLGYKYSKWDVDEMLIDISGTEMSSDMLDAFAMKFGMDSSIGYFGLGYSF